MSSSNDNRTGRLFFALWPDAALVEQLVRMQQRFGGASARTNHPLDLHMTLVFLGAVQPERMAAIRQAAAAVRGSPFTLKLSRVGSWRKPRILWAAPGDSPAPLCELVTTLNNNLAGCGFTPELRPYRPHVTLARKGPAVDQQPLAPTLHWRVTEFVLATSGGQPPGPRYRVLGNWSLDS